MGEVIMKRTVSKETLDFLRGQIAWNKEKQGERGEYIRTKYVYNLIDDMEKAMSSNKVRMNWPFAEESVQEGANTEMDEDEGAQKMAAASEMLEALEETVNALESQQSWRNHPSLIDPIKRCKAVIKAARGSEDG